MALEATHIRFALDVKTKYQVSDTKRYISGTIYPDSRYVTGIDRNLTHPDNYPDWNLVLADDFKKGWFVHLLCDKIQYRVTKEKLPHIYSGVTGQGSEVWIKSTAIKILLDIDDAKKFDIKTCLPCLSQGENPNGEDVQKIQQYNHIFQKMYADPAQVNIESYYAMWKEFGIGDALAMQVKQKAEEYSRDAATMDVVRKVYSEMLLKV